MPDFSFWSLAGGAAVALGSAWIGSQFSQRNTISQWLRDKRLGCFVEITKAISELVIEVSQFSDDPRKASIERYRVSLQKLRDSCDTLFWVGTPAVNRVAWRICDFFELEVTKFLDYEKHKGGAWTKLMSDLNKLQSDFDSHARASLKANHKEWRDLRESTIFSRYRRLRKTISN